MMAVEMEAAALYMNAAYNDVNAIAVMTISDHFVTGEKGHCPRNVRDIIHRHDETGSRSCHKIERHIAKTTYCKKEKQIKTIRRINRESIRIC